MSFRKQLDIEIYKLEGLYGNVAVSTPTVISEDVLIEKLSLNQIMDRDPAEYRKIKDVVFARYTDTKGFITCATSGFKSQMRFDFQIDHIKPMSEGGLTTMENLQVLSRKAHIEKTQLENFRRRNAAQPM